MSFLTINWVAPYSMGVMPQDPSVVLDAPLTVPWNPKQSVYVLPYDVADLTQKAAPTAPGVDPPVDPPVIVNPPETPAPPPVGAIGVGGGGVPDPATPGTPVPAPAPAPGAVRPATPARLLVQGRTNPVNFRAKGIRIRVTLPEAARVQAVVQARVRKRLSRRRTTTSTQKISRTRNVRLKAGTTALRLAPSAAGRRAVGRRTSLAASVVVTVRYADGRRSTIRRAVRIAPATSSKR